MLSDERLRSLERVVRLDYSDIRARLALYSERKRHGFCETIRPTMPLPARPACLGSLDDFRWRVGAIVGVGMGELLVAGAFVNATAIGSRFTGRFAETMAPKDENECHRYLVAMVGYKEAFAAWSKFSVVPKPGSDICVGLVAVVALSVEHGERLALKSEAASARRAAKAKLDGEKHRKVAGTAPCSRCGAKIGILCKTHPGDRDLVHPHKDRIIDVDPAKRQAANRRNDDREVAREATKNAERKEGEAFLASYWAECERLGGEQAALDAVAQAARDAELRSVRDRLKNAPQDDEGTGEPDYEESILNASFDDEMPCYESRRHTRSRRWST